MYLIEELAGPVPKSMLTDPTNYSKLYDVNGYLQNVNEKIKRWDLVNVFKDNYDNMGCDDMILQNIVKFINSTLCIIPANRPNIKTMLSNINNI